jgi:subtilisin family serine protease
MGFNHANITTKPKRLTLCLILFLSTLALVACNRHPVFAGPAFLSVRPADVLTVAQPSKDLTIQNPTRSTIAWRLTLVHDSNNPQAGEWFTISQTQGEVSGSGATTLTLNLTSGLPTGLYTSTVTISYQDKQERFIVLGQIPGSATGTASLTGQVTTDNALIPVLNARQAPAQLARTQPIAAHYVPNQVLVKYKEAEPSAHQAPTNQTPTLSAQQLETYQSLLQTLSVDYQLRLLEPALPGQTALFETVQSETNQDVEAVAAALSRDPRVEYATPNYYLEALELPNDTNISEQWALSVAGLPVGWQVETGSSNPVTVAVLDTGFDLNHEDLTGRFWPGYDFCGKTQGATETPSITCSSFDADPGFGNTINNHGTHVAGILAATGNNGKGVVGAAYGSNVKLLPVKIFDDSGNAATIDTFAKGIRWAVGLEVSGVPLNEHPARIINLSLGGIFLNKDGSVNQGSLRFIQDAVDAASSAGALVIAATGNDNGANYVRTPAAADHVLGVGSVDTALERSNFSNYSAVKKFGPGGVDLMAPGNDILSTIPQNNSGLIYGLLSGTSMSTPVISGIAALVLSHEPELSPEALEQRLLAATYFDTSYMTENEYGKGVLRADLVFGLPGPGSNVAVAVGSTGMSALATTKLDVYGGSSPFTLNNLAGGSYRLVTLANGTGGQLSGLETLDVQDAEQKTANVVIKKLQ